MVVEGFGKVELNLKRVLFVCTGNTCRSPMAANILTHIAKRNGFPLEVQSAGIYAIPGDTITPQAQKVLSGAGIDTNHRAQQVDQRLLQWADIVLTMTTHHKHSILMDFPDVREKVYTLTEYIAADSTDIVDPFGAPVEAYQLCAKELEYHLDHLIIKWSKE